MALLLLSGFLTIAISWTLHARRYYIVLVPFCSALASFGFQWWLSRKRVLLAGSILCVAFLACLGPVYSEYALAWEEVVQGERSDTADRVIAYLRQRDVQGKYVYFHTAHIGYWLTGALIPTRFIHPTDMDKPKLLEVLYTKSTTPQLELEQMLSKKPVYIITRLRSKVTEPESQFIGDLDKALDNYYVLEKKFDNVGVFKRR